MVVQIYMDIQACGNILAELLINRLKRSGYCQGYYNSVVIPQV